MLIDILARWIVQMPLFFTVSGYLAYKDKEHERMDTLHRFLVRSRILLVPLVVWSVIFSVNPITRMVFFGESKKREC